MINNWARNRKVSKTENLGVERKPLDSGVN